MDVGAEPNVPQRIPELWFDDGNIVIQAGNIQFRVYRGILAARSPVFQDMLSFPQPLDSELVEGCPLVHLNDAAAEVTVFLKAIFEAEFFKQFPALTEFDTIVGCLRLSHKYGVEYLRRRALIHLSSGYRTTLSEWDAYCEPGDFEEGAPIPLEAASWSRPNVASYRICLIELAREVEAVWILPAAFYWLSANWSELGSKIFHGTDYNGVPVSLSTQDQESFVKGHAIQSHSTTADVLRFLFYPPNIENCASERKCARARFGAIDSMRVITSRYPSVPLDVWESGDWNLLDDLCPTCLATLKTAHQAARQAFWDKLPEMYGLPAWEELEKMKVAAIGTNWLS
ncbi:hypothetical protein B0H11DRAFT_2392517 [Mycena galericulata]|nr:hypothetical protein B0H11DRAFT_2392517 [Mycena galericulata]